jgi:hypothetical protein
MMFPLSLVWVLYLRALSLVWVAVAANAIPAAEARTISETGIETLGPN